MPDTQSELVAQVEAVVQRLMLDPSAGPTRAELEAASRAEVPSSGLTMAQMVATSGLSEHTLRYYEREGLLTVPRLAGGHRCYDAAAVQRIQLATRMRMSGMPMATLKRLASLLDTHGVEHPEVRALLETHRSKLQRQIAELQVALAITNYKLETGSLAPRSPLQEAHPTTR